jgi:hypothetical protein
MDLIKNRFFTLTLSSLVVFSAMALSVSASVPNFIQESIYASNQAEVAEIVEVDRASIIFLNDGLNAGFDIGMTATVRRGAQEVASILIVASEPSKSAAMILELKNQQSIEVGDNVKIKTTRLS